MKSIYLLPFILAIASSAITTAVDLSNLRIASLSILTCFKAQSTNLFMMEFMSSSGTVNPNFAMNFFNSRLANINVDAIIRLNDASPPETLANYIASALPVAFNRTVYFEISRFNLWGRPLNQRISYLEQVVQACRKHGVSTGIYSSAEDWMTMMGSQGAGSDILKAIPLWYEHDDGVQDFSDFSSVGFGTWDKPTMKNFGATKTACIDVESVNIYDDEA